MLVNVQLPGATEITQMDDSLLQRREYVDAKDNDWDVHVIEYWHPDHPSAPVHRSPHVGPKGHFKNLVIK